MNRLVECGTASIGMGRDRRARRSAGWLMLVLTLVVASGCAVAPLPRTPLSATEMPPPAPREFRGAWVATVANIDWPSKPGLPVEQQRAEIIAILDRSRTLHLNAIVLQVRPAADALYASPLEPWSEYLTGTQGRAPEPYYDPLRVWIDEAHRRGLQLHAWINPYRARHASAKSAVARSHVSNVYPGAVKRYGDQLWMDPGDERAAKETLRVVNDIVARYDIDGIHIDDYFYPYPVQAAGDFPDEPSWRHYLARGGTLDRAAWRRHNVDALIERMYESTHALKPWVAVGISPFGIGRPDRRPAGIVGFSQFDSLYADVELWLQRGWLDYLVPQLYWPIAQKPQAFPVLLDYWIRQNTQGRHIWPGLIPSSVATGARAWSADEILHQIGIIREQARGGLNNGHIHFSMVALMHDRGSVAAKLEHGPYAQQALVPATPWLGTRPPHPPRLDIANGAGVASAHIRPSWFGPRPATFAVWRRYAGQWRFAVLAESERLVDVRDADALVVSAVDRLGNESARVGVVVPEVTR